MCMKLDDRALDNVAEDIKRYCQEQKDIIETFCHDIKMLEENWAGNNFGNLLDKVEDISNLATEVLDDIYETFVTYFNEKADMIRNRPSFSGIGGGSATSSSAANKENFFDKVFAKFNKEIVTRIYFYLRRINFYTPNEKISFYDPNGKSRRGLYKNIMAIDLSSPTFEQDMLSLTGQHMFFQIKQFDQMNLIRSVANEISNKSFLNDVEFKKLSEQITSGKGIEDKYLSFPDQNTKQAFNFFANAFKTTLSNDSEGIKKYEKYFSNSYYNFREILNNLIGF